MRMKQYTLIQRYIRNIGNLSLMLFLATEITKCDKNNKITEKPKKYWKYKNTIRKKVKPTQTTIKMQPTHTYMSCKIFILVDHL